MTAPFVKVLMEKEQLKEQVRELEKKLKIALDNYDFKEEERRTAVGRQMELEAKVERLERAGRALLDEITDGGNNVAEKLVDLRRALEGREP